MCWPNAPQWSSGYRPHQPGEFYRREPSPLCAVLGDVSGLGLLVVDSYADLDPGARPGMSAHAYAEFGIPAVGVAKSRFRTTNYVVQVVRGSSVRPLFVTAAGMPSADAADLVRRMATGTGCPTHCVAPIPRAGKRAHSHHDGQSYLRTRAERCR